MGTLVSDLLTTFWYQPYALYKYGFEKSVLIYYKDFIKYSFITLLEVIICIFIILGLHLPMTIVTLFIEFVIGLSVFALVTFVLFRKNEYYIFLKNTLLEQLSKIKAMFVKSK